jgi:hypothetical protein
MDAIFLLARLVSPTRERGRDVLLARGASEGETSALARASG